MCIHLKLYCQIKSAI